MVTRRLFLQLLGCTLLVAIGAAGCQRPRARVPGGDGSPSPGGAPAAGAAELLTLPSGGETRQYLLHVPPDLSGTSPVALVVNIHGFTSNAFEQERLSGMSAKADAEGFIVVYPQALGDPPTWRVGPLEGGAADQAFITDLIAHLATQFPIDPRRIFATGISNGGGMVDRLVCEQAGLFAAAGPVSGAYLFGGMCTPTRPVPIVAFHGTADQIVPYEGQGRVLPAIPLWAAAWADRNTCASGPSVVNQHGEVTAEAWSGCSQGADVVLYTVEGRGHSWPGASLLPGLDLATQDIDATDVIWDFFKTHPMP